MNYNKLGEKQLLASLITRRGYRVELDRRNLPKIVNHNCRKTQNVETEHFTGGSYYHEPPMKRCFRCLAENKQPYLCHVYISKYAVEHLEPQYLVIGCPSCNDWTSNKYSDLSTGISHNKYRVKVITQPPS